MGLRSQQRAAAAHAANEIMTRALQKSTTAFGAFVDIGSSTDGLLHISQLSVSCSPRFVLLVGACARWRCPGSH